MQVKNSDFGGGIRRLAAVAVTLALAAAVATESDSQAQLLSGQQSLSIQTPSVSIQAPGASVEVPPVQVAPPAPVAPPKVTLPPAPVKPPPVPVAPPSLPVKPPSPPVKAPSLPVKPPSLPSPPVKAPSQPVKAPSPPVKAPSLPVKAPSLPDRQSLPATSPSPSLRRSLQEQLSRPGSSPASGPRMPSLQSLLGANAVSRSGVAGSPATGGSTAIADALSEAIPGMARFPTRSELAKLPPAQRRELVRLAFDTPLRAQRLRQLRNTIREYGDCLRELPNRGRRTLELRAGLFGREPVSRRVIARRIGTSPMGVLRLERSSLRRLIRAGEDGLCGSSAGAVTATANGGPESGSAGPSGEGGAGGRDLRPTGEVLADVAEGGPGIDLGDGKEGAAESLLFFLLALFALLAPLAAIAIAMQRRAGSAAAAGHAGERPLLFLDVDGVIALNAFSSGLPPGEMRVSPLGFIYLPDRAGGLVRKLATRFDIVWATGWEHHANTGLLRPLGLRDELPVLTFGKRVRSGSSEWKLKRVKAYAGHRPAAWLDDNLVNCHERWAAGRSEPTLLVPVDPRAGLTQDHVERLLHWADRVAPSGEATKSNGQRRAQAS